MRGLKIYAAPAAERGEEIDVGLHDTVRPSQTIGAVANRRC